MIGGGLGPYAPGEWSDDTQMAVVIARVAADRGLRTVDALDAIVTGWVDWLAAGATDVGTQTRQVLGAVAAEGSRRAWSAAASASTGLHRRTGRTAGNGSLMRTAPGGTRAPRRPGDADARRTLALRRDPPRPAGGRRVRPVVPRDPAGRPRRRAARPGRARRRRAARPTGAVGGLDR